MTPRNPGKRAATDRRERFREAALRDKRLYAVGVTALVGVFVWFVASGPYHAYRIEALPLEHELPARVDVQLTGFVVTYHFGRGRSGYSLTGALEVHNRADELLELSGKRLALDLCADDETRWSLGIYRPKTVFPSFEESVEARPRDGIGPGARRLFRFSAGRRPFLGDVDRLVVRLRE